MLSQCFLLLTFLTAQNTALPQKQPIDFFTTRHGLVDNHITALLHEPNGYLWVGTAGGLSRFDGQNFDNFFDEESAPTEKISALAFGEDQRVWIASNRQLIYWKDNHFTSAKTFDSSIRLLVKGMRGRLWVALDEGLALLEGGQWTAFDRSNNFPDFRITEMYEDGKGELWVGFRNGGVTRIHRDGKSWDQYNLADGLPHATINHFLETADGRMWVATHGGVAIWHDDQFSPAPFNDQLPSPIIYRLYEDRSNSLWMTASNAGAARWDGDRLRVFNRDSGLASNFTVDFLQDRWGHVWILCRGGVSMHFHDQLAAIGEEEGLQGRLMTVFLKGDDGLIWIGTSSGLNRYEEPRLKTYLLDPSDQLDLSRASNTIYKDSQGRLWFPSFAGLGFAHEDRFKTFTESDGLPARLTMFWQENERGEIWVGTERGAAYFDGTAFQPIDDERLRDQAIINMVLDKQDRVWLLTGDWNLYHQGPDGAKSFELIGRYERVIGMEVLGNGGLWLSQQKKLTLLSPDQKETIFPIDELVGEHSMVVRHFDDNETWWFGTLEGLIRFDGKETEVFTQLDGDRKQGVGSIATGANGRIWFNTIDPESNVQLQPRYTGVGVYDQGNFRHYSSDEGLHARIPHLFRVDNRGNEWLLSSKGLSWIEEGKVEHLGVSDSLAGNRPYALFWDRNDHLWIGTNGGLNKRSGNLLTTLGPSDGLLDAHVYDAKADGNGAIWIRTRNGVQRYRENPNPPEIDLIGVSDGDRVLPLETGIELDHHQNNLIFHLRGIHLGRGADQMHFTYSLRGKNKEWRGVTRESQLHFPGLGPDTYTFTVRAYNRDLESSRNPQTFSFTILPPWWLTWWFLASALATGFLVGYIVYRVRLGVRLEKARVFSELRTAHDMQLSLMPKKAPTTPRLQIFGACEPAREVGGDYFDYFWLDEEREELGIAIMDVAGKSMEAAIISVMASGLVCSEIGQRNSPSAILSRINFPLYQKTGKKIFTTGLIAALHTRTMQFRWANAGHLDPILVRDGELVPIVHQTKRDLPLGAVRDWEYCLSTETLKPGDLLLLYTDGLTEACDKQGQFFGLDKLEELLKRHSNLSSEALVGLLMDKVHEFSGSMPQFDDITLVAIKVKTNT